MYSRQNRSKINLYGKKSRETDLIFKLACTLRSKTSIAFKCKNVRKIKKTFDILKCSHSFFKNSNFHQLYGNMIEEHYGSVWQIDHFLPIASSNQLDESDMKKCFNWFNSTPM